MKPMLVINQFENYVACLDTYLGKGKWKAFDEEDHPIIVDELDCVVPLANLKDLLGVK